MAASTVAGLAALGLGVGVAPAASAATTGPGIQIDGVLGDGLTWAGALENTGGLDVPSSFLFWCIQSGYISPDLPVNSAGQLQDPELAYAITTHQDEADKLTRAALGAWVHLSWDMGTDEVTADERRASWEQVLRADYPRVWDKVNELKAEAAKYAGGYTATGQVDLADDGRTGTFTGVGVKSRAGHYVPGLKLFLDTGSDAVVWDANGERTMTVDSSTAGAAFGLHTTAARAKVTASVTAEGLPATTLEVGDPGIAKIQAVAAASRPVSVSHTADAKNLRLDFQPVVTTKVKEKVIEQGESLIDTVQVATDGDSWLDVDGKPVDVVFTGTAYRAGDVPVGTPADEVPADAQVIDTATITADGPGTFEADFGAASEAGMVTFVWQVVDTEEVQGDAASYIRSDWSDSYGLADETTSVRHQIDVNTSASFRETKSGLYLVDDMWVDGFPDDHGDFAGGAGFDADVKQLDQTLYFFPEGAEIADDNLDAATTIGSIDVPAVDGFRPTTGSNDFKVVTETDDDGNEVKVPGTYVFVTHFAGDDRVAPFTSSVTDTTEQLVVTPESSGFTVTTEAKSSGDVVVGDEATVYDEYTATGTLPEGATIDFELYSWDSDGAPVCTEPVLSTDDKTALAKSGRSSDLVITKVAEDTTYGFVEVVTGADGTELYRGECGVAAETIVPTAAADDTPAVPADSPAGGGELAQTGANTLPAVGAAVLLTAAGLGLLLWRRRQSA
ncbi:LPXTG cell wall anchor domain-containing protein [Isoptericola sp. NPDC057191]|uniref:LPXTG cell wall anchor domain-containing protein n=1 Tax=Isoptericola sp. NPDC057191 TaxID=3346041 RepID=UPI003642FE2D